MSAVIKWNASASKQVSTIHRPKWREIRQGLTLAVIGQALALVLGLVGVYIVTTEGGPLAERLNVSGDDASAIGWGLLGGAGFGYLLLLVGHWRCLVYAPQGHGAKDLQYACLLCSLVTPVFFGVAHYLGGTATYAALRHGPPELVELELLRPGPLLQLAGLLSGLGAVMLFSGFARAVTRCLNDADATRGITCYFWFVAFLLGATAGLVMQIRRTTPPSMLFWLALAWMLCLLWHELLLFGACRRITRVLRGERLGPSPTSKATQVKSGQVVLQAAEYLKETEESFR